MKALFLICSLGLSLPAIAASTDRASCFNDLPKKICVVDAPSGNETVRNRPCLNEDTSTFVKKLNDAYKAFPKNYQRALCSLQNIYIERDSDYFGYTAYTWFHDVSQMRSLKGAYMRFGQAKVENMFNGKTTFSGFFREDLTAQFSDTLTEKQLSVVSNLDAFTYLLAHELTHLIDLRNGLNRIADDECAKEILRPSGFNSYQCPLSKKSYGRMSWTDTVTKNIKDSKVSEVIDQIYSPNGPQFTYKDLARFLNRLYYGSGFISPYATFDPWEDLGEVAGFVVAAKAVKNPKFLIRGVDHKGRAFQINMLKRLEDRPYRNKSLYVRKMLGMENIPMPEPAK